MKFIIEKNFMVLKVEEKAKFDLYTLIDLEQGDKVTAIGAKAKEKISKMDVVAAVINVTLKSEKFETKKDGDKYVQTANTFVSDVQKVNVK